MQEVATPQQVLPRKVDRDYRKRIWRNKYLYMMITPGLLYFIIFKYFPMYGLIISFQDYKSHKGITGSNLSDSSILYVYLQSQTF